MLIYMKKVISLISIAILFSCELDFKELKKYSVKLRYSIPIFYVNKDYVYFKDIIDKSEKKFEKQTSSVLNLSKENNVDSAYFFIDLSNGYPINVRANIDIMNSLNTVLATIKVDDVRMASIDKDYNLKKPYDTTYTFAYHGRLLQGRNLKFNISLFWDNKDFPSNMHIDANFFLKIKSKVDLIIKREQK